MAEVRYKWRIGVLASAVAVMFAVIGVRLCFIQLKPQAWVVEPIRKNRTLELKPVGNRGRIVDRNGEILAMDMTAFHVCLDPKDIHEHGDADAVARYMSKEFHIPEADLREHLSKTEKRWVAIKRYVPEQRLSRFERKTYGVVYTPRQPDSSDRHAACR